MGRIDFPLKNMDFKYSDFLIKSNVWKSKSFKKDLKSNSKSKIYRIFGFFQIQKSNPHNYEAKPNISDQCMKYVQFREDEHKEACT